MTLNFEENATYIEELVRITEHEERKLITKVISVVKVIWRQQKTKEEASWEVEREMRNCYPRHFES